LAYVYAYSDNSLPMEYLISSFWGGQEGSFLLWTLCGVLLGLPLLRFAKLYETRVMFIYNLTILSLILLLVKQDPFLFHEGLTVDFLPMDGAGLNPLLQNPWMVIHPPVMFIGYASLAIPFAFALAALWMRRYDDWVKVSMPWVLISVGTLGTAIMMGGYWAYETLGWGGYWGWDPVENASLVPWLATVALTHGLLLQRGRNRFRRLNLVLAVSAYLLVVYATFLTRSGVLSDFSVHSFVDLGISGWLVFNMIFFLLLSIALLTLRWREIPAEVGEEPFISRTIFFVLGIVMLILIGLVVVFGTSAPLITRLWMETPAQVGPDFYNGLGFWLAIVLAAVLGATPFLSWHRARKDAGKKLIPVGVVTVVLIVVAIISGARDWRSLLYFAVVFFCIVGNGWAIIEKVRSNVWRRIGGELTHVGLGLMMVAFVASGWFDAEAKVRLIEGEAAEVLGYTMTFAGVDKPTPTSHDAMVVEVTPPNGTQFTMRPLMWVNEKSNQLVASPDIRSFFLKDLYVAPIQFDPREDAPVGGRLVFSKVELLGLGGGIGRQAVMKRGESLDYKDLKVTFVGFDLSDFDLEAGKADFGVVFNVERDDETLEVVPRYSQGRGEPLIIPAVIPESGGLSLSIGKVSSDDGSVQMRLFDPFLPEAPTQPAGFVVDVSTKPLISLIWIGTLLMIAGVFLAIMLRRHEVGSVVG
ncbi:MAG: cytochrome c biogenesis protein CcsA, partial [Thermoanaerobaculales bacterium]|nr:cytochrome c biogenesis protein CcsA [Thermoanaerobaculales bacterium]